MTIRRDWSVVDHLLGSLKISPIKWRATMLEDRVSSTSDTADAIAAVLFSQNLKILNASEREEIFAENDREVLRRKIRQGRGRIQCLGVDEDGVSHILGRIMPGYEKVRVMIVENFVGEPYYKFLYDDDDLFGDRV